jgi:hypothetical protein
VFSEIRENGFLCTDKTDCRQKGNHFFVLRNNMKSYETKLALWLPVADDDGLSHAPSEASDSVGG